MKNNTKLIMETWRRFLSEGPQEDPGQFKDPSDPDLEGARVSDADLEGDIALADQMNSDPEHEAYNPQGVGELEPLPDNMYGGATHEERVQSVYNRLMRDPQDPLQGFTDQEKEEGLVRYEERPGDPDMEAYDNSFPGYGNEYDSGAAGEELASLGPIDDEPMDDY